MLPTYIQAGGAGIQVGIGAGIGIFTGCTFVTNGGLFSFFGSGVHQFLGAGVLINTGVTTNLNLGIGKRCVASCISDQMTRRSAMITLFRTNILLLMQP